MRYLVITVAEITCAHSCIYMCLVAMVTSRMFKIMVAGIYMSM